MTVKVGKTGSLKYRKVFENMLFLNETGTHAIERNNTSESRVSSTHTENQLPPKSSICRTMTIGHTYLDTDTNTGFQPSNTSELQISTFNLQNQKSESSKTSSQEEILLAVESNSSSIFPFNYHPASTEIMKQSMKKSENMSGFVRLLSENLTMRSCSSRSEPYSYDSSTISTVSSRSSSSAPSKSYYSNPNGHWAFGMILFVSIILSTLSTSSVVMCMPLGNDEAVSSQSESNRRSGAAVIMSNSKLIGLDEKSSPVEEGALYSLHNKGQLYFPSVLKNDQATAANAALASSVDYPIGGYLTRGSDEDQQNYGGHPLSNYDIERVQTAPENNPTTKNRTPIQKLLPAGIGLALGEERDDFDDGYTSDTASFESGLQNVLDSGVNEDRVSEGQPEWETVIDPHLYVLTEWNTQPYQEKFPLGQQQRKRRNSGTGPSLSIVNPLDVLRQRLLLEIARRRMRQSHNQIIANEEILRKIGRRRR